LLVELVASPPVGGDRLAQLAVALELPSAEIASAADALAAAGLARVDGDVIAASDAALYVDALCQLRVSE
jgi:hypothetical protein